MVAVSPVAVKAAPVAVVNDVLVAPCLAGMVGAVVAPGPPVLVVASVVVVRV